MNLVSSRRVQVIASRVALATLLVLPSAATAQRISGTVREADGGRLISGGFISLLDPAGEAVRADFTAVDGAFSFLASGPGEYRIRVERIGYANWVTEPYAGSHARSRGTPAPGGDGHEAPPAGDAGFLRTQRVGGRRAGHSVERQPLGRQPRVRQ